MPTLVPSDRCADADLIRKSANDVEYLGLI
jgi:hypothetical protein